MRIDIITLFPKMFESPFRESIIGRAINKKLIELNYFDMRKYAWNKYGAVDDKPFGGDLGMLIRADVIWKALEDVKNIDKEIPKVILTSAKGKKFNQEMAEKWSKNKRLLFICGRYEGFDQRIADQMVDEEVSIGDYIITGGELATMVMIDAVTRLLPGVLGKDESNKVESFSKIKIDEKYIRPIEFPQYTRPQEFMSNKIPDILISGDRKKIKEWQNNIMKKRLKDSTAKKD